MARLFADITHKYQGEAPDSLSPVVVSPKTRRLNVESMKVSREIRLAVLAHDPVSLRAALSSAEQLGLDTHLIKAARSSLTDMETDAYDENTSPVQPSAYDNKEGTPSSFSRLYKAFLPSTKVQNQIPSTKRSLTLDPSENKKVKKDEIDSQIVEGEVESRSSSVVGAVDSSIAYSLSVNQHPLFDDKSQAFDDKSQTSRIIQNIPAEGSQSKDCIPDGVSRFKNVLQPALSEKIARIRLESAKVDITCKDLTKFIKHAHEAQEKVVSAMAVLAEESSSMSIVKSGMTLDAPWLLLRGQLLSKVEQDKDILLKLREDAMLPVATAIPSIEIEIRSLFEEAAFLELECSKAMTDMEKFHNREIKFAESSRSTGEDNDSVDIPSRGRRASTTAIPNHDPPLTRERRFSAVLLRRPSLLVQRQESNHINREQDNVCSKVEATVMFKRMYCEYLKRLPEIIQRVYILNEKRLNIIKSALSVICANKQNHAESEVGNIRTLAEVVGRIDVDKDLSTLRSLSDTAFATDAEYTLSASMNSLQPGLCSKFDSYFFDPSRYRSYPVDFSSGNGFDIALDHAITSKQTVSSLYSLIMLWLQIFQQQSESLTKAAKTVQSMPGNANHIGDGQNRALNSLIKSTQFQSASFQKCSNSLNDSVLLLRDEKQAIKRLHRCITEVRSRGTRELHTVLAHEQRCKETRDRLETEFNKSTLLINSSYENASGSNQAQLDNILSKVERDEKSFRQADLTFRNAQHSVQATQETQAIMHCQFLSQLQQAEESRLHVCSKSMRLLGQSVHDLINSIEQSDLDVLAAFSAIDINKDLRQFIEATYSSGEKIDESDFVADYVNELAADGFGPAYDHTMAGLMQMKSMLIILENWADPIEYSRTLSKVKVNPSSTELPSVQNALIQCQHLVMGVCQAIEDHASSYREILTSVSKQRHTLKAEARKIRKNFAAGHRRVTLATHNHGQAVEAQRKYLDKLQTARGQSSGPNPGQTMSMLSLTKFFSRDASKTLQKAEQGMNSSKCSLETSVQELSSAIHEREVTVQTTLRGLQEIEVHRVAALQWCVPTLMNHRHEKFGQIAELAQALHVKCSNLDLSSGLQKFITDNCAGTPPPTFLIQRAMDLATRRWADGQVNSAMNSSKSVSYCSEDEEGYVNQNLESSPANIIDEERCASHDDLFGGSLNSASLQNGVAKVVTTCIAFLSIKQQELSANIFRNSAPPEEVQALVNEFSRDQNLALVTQSTASVASVLKLYIMQLHPSLIPSTRASELLSIYKNASSDQRVSKARQWLAKLPAVNRNTLKLILLFLSDMSQCPTSQATAMSITNIAVSWSPVLLKSAVGTTIQAVSRLLHDTPSIFSESA